MKHGHGDLGGFEIVPRETRRRLEAFAQAVLQWNRTIKLVSASDMDALWKRHVLDSLQLVDLLPSGCALAVDLGSGAGFPGMVLAIATGLMFDLVESDKRKSAFLTYAAQLTSAPVRVHPCRIEECGISGADVVTSRALAPLRQLLNYAAPLLAPHGMCLLPKGENASAEIADAATVWRMHVRRVPSRVSDCGEVLCISELSRA